MIISINWFIYRHYLAFWIFHILPESHKIGILNYFFFKKRYDEREVQAKMYDVKRLDKKIGMINKDDFERLRIQFGILFGFLPQEDLRASPEGNCSTIVAVQTSNVNKAVDDE